ncbi:hypothetical protein B0H10DRAFT_1820677 [Mycena sp. CBHHK59/15]|nr:hypothetical protein B0H10DRAFT_1820677 [Mycena sp. CBHHK59/15]
MPPKQTRRPKKQEVEENCRPLQRRCHISLNNARLALVQLPAELFDAIIENYTTLPSTFYYDTSDIPTLEHYERSEVLTALSQTCRALRNITLHRLWARLDICRVPVVARSTWYKYIMQELERKANGVAVSPVRHYVRTLALMFSKSNPGPTLAALWKMLPALSNLRKIHVINCKTPGFAKSLTDSGLKLPNVTTLFIPSEASVLQRISPNAVHIRCVGGSGAALISALTDKSEVFDGMVDWTYLKLADRLVKKAPNLRTLEIRRPVNNGLGIASQDKAPSEWAQIFPKLSAMKKLAQLILTFPGEEEIPTDLVSINAARTVLQKSALQSEKCLIVRRVIAPHYENEYRTDFVHSSKTEIFD